jgi:PIN domain nuclease of toxin-antitoxin system
MRILLDTHAFLWWITDDDRLGPRARRAIADGSNDIFFSAASGWEIVVKAGLGRLRVSDEIKRFIPAQIAANGFQVLPVHLRHALAIHALPALHRDPFDRLLIAQALTEALVIATGDAEIKRYAVKVLW